MTALIPTVVYLAAMYSRREELLKYKQDLEELEYHVSSRWLLGQHEMQPVADTDPEGTVEQRERFATEDYADLMSSDIVISFTEPPGTGPMRGGRHVEFGIGIAAGKEMIVVGHRENVFHCLPGVGFYVTWEEALESFRADALAW